MALNHLEKEWPVIFERKQKEASLKSEINKIKKLSGLLRF